MPWIITKTTIGVIFNIQKKHFRYTAKMELWQFLHWSIFALNREEYYYQGHWIRNFPFFFLYFGFLLLLGKFECHCLQAIWIFQRFSCHIARKFRQTKVKAWSFVHQRDQVARTCWHVSSWLAISNTGEKISYFSHVLLRLFLGLEILIWRRSLYDKELLYNK